MKLTKLGIGIIVVLLVVNAVCLSLLVANLKIQYQPYTMMRIDYLQLLMNDEANFMVAKYDLPLLGVFVQAGDANGVDLLVSWASDIRNIGDLETVVGDSLADRLETHLRKLYAMHAWTDNPTITCVHMLDSDEVERVKRTVSTRNVERINTPTNARGVFKTPKSPTPSEVPKRTAKVVQEDKSTNHSGLQRITASSYLFTDDAGVWAKNSGKRVVVSGTVTSARYGIITLSVGYKSVECKMAQHFTDAELTQLERQATNLTIVGTVRMTNENQIRLQGCRIQ